MKSAHVFLFVLALVPTTVFAYVGPGVGLGAIATFVAIVIGLFLLIVGFLWYPLKRLFRNLRAPKTGIKPDDAREVRKE